jgi:CIC family chloride channel protein
MGAFFGATVRAPVTAVVLVMEMTATTAVGIPMLGATAAAVLVAELTKSPPIYDSLRERMSPEVRRGNSDPEDYPR